MESAGFDMMSKTEIIFNSNSNVIFMNSLKCSSWPVVDGISCSIIVAGSRLFRQVATAVKLEVTEVNVDHRRQDSGIARAGGALVMLAANCFG